MSAAFGPEAGNGTERRQRSRAELEMEAGRLAAERRAGRHRAQRAGEPTNANGAALVGSGDTVEGLVAAPAKQAQVTRGLPPEVLKAFATVPDHLKGEACRGELGVGVDPTPGAHSPTAGNPEGSCSGAAFDGAAALPQFIRPNFERMPPELKSLRNWVLWAAIWNGSKWTKRPVQVSGFGASTTNPKHWASFDDVKQAYERAAQRGYLELREKGKMQEVLIGGVGFVFDGQPDPDGLVFAGVDFDGAVSPQQKITSFTAEQVKRLGSYTEASVSGTGIHVILKARPLSSGVAHDGVELYTSARFFTITGSRSRTPIVAAPDAFAALAGELAQRKGAARREDGASSFATVPPHLQGLSGSGELGAGIEPRDWFKLLPAEKQSEVVKYAAEHIANNSKLFELRDHGGSGYQEYLRLTLAIARSGVADAEDIFVEAASIAKDADSEEELRKFFQDCVHAKHKQLPADDITVGTLIYHAKQCGANFDQWKREVVSVPWLPPQHRKPLRGGRYAREEALELINSHYFIGKTDKQIGIFRIKDDGSIVFTTPDQLKLDLDNIFIGKGDDPRTKGDKFWREKSNRRQCKIVFKLSNTEPDEYNLWRGFAIEPRKGWQKQRRLLRHIRNVVCRRDKPKFKYLMRWLAFLVQHPDQLPGTVIVLKSRKEGTGKSTVGEALRKIFGPHHSALVDDKERIVGRFNDWLEPMCFILAEEILWAGDRRSTDKLKSRITAPQIPMERKNGAIWQADNRLHCIMTTNHEHAVAAGVGDRRYVVYDVSAEHANEKSWFTPLYRDLDAGGANEFLWLLQKLRLGDWHPRQIIKTEEAREQQRMSAGSISEWSQACIDADAITEPGPYAIKHNLGTFIPSEHLRQAYSGYCRQNGLHPASGGAFGKACTEMFGQRGRPRVQQNTSGAKGGPRPWGYNVPDGKTWQGGLDAWLGLK